MNSNDVLSKILSSHQPGKEDLEIFINLLDSGDIRASEKINETWQVNSRVKECILSYLKNSDFNLYETNPSNYHDKIDLKFKDKNSEYFKENQIRALVGSFVRKGVYIGKSTVIMPSIINIGAYIDDRTMIDMGAVVGSCAQIGKNCHISANAVIGGVLEPVNQNPVIIEDNCFIGALSSITEGVIIEESSVIASGVHISNSTKILDRETGEISFGVVKKGSVIVAGSVLSNNAYLSCAVVVKKNNTTADKTKINELLRSL